MCSNKSKILISLTIMSGLVFATFCVLTAMNSRYYQINYNSSLAEVVNYTSVLGDCFNSYRELVYSGYIIFDYKVWVNNSYSVYTGQERVSCGNYTEALQEAEKDYPLNTTFNIFYEISNPNNWLRSNNTVLYVIASGVSLGLFLIISTLFICEQCFRRKNEYQIIN